MKLDRRSFKFRLWTYFILFTALIFTVLWLLQTVFLQSFYNAMVISNTKKAVSEIVSSSQSDDISTIIDKLSRDNSLLVFITDTDGKLLYSSDEFKMVHNRFRGNKEKKNRSGNDFDDYRYLPDDYSEFLEQLEQSENGTAEFSDDSLYIYGTYFEYGSSGKNAVLYVSTVLEAVGSSVTIISMQLIWVTALSLLSGFILSWFIARKFALPVDRLSEKAKHLGEDDYSSDFKKGFCSELDELNETLDKTNEKLIRARDFQMELLADVSHDLRTPVTMIKGYAEMIQDISWEDEKSCREDLSVIIREADRLTALVNEIMEYSELKSDSSRSELEKLDLSALTDRVSDSFGLLHKPDQLIIKKDIASGISVPGNAGQLERVLYNLMDNASRHTGEDKTIEVSLHRTDGNAVLSVKDSGSGIDPSQLEHIWDRYYTSRMRKGKGASGLGLAIVRQITILHNGHCYAQSEPGKGSTFIVELPLDIS